MSPSSSEGRSNRGSGERGRRVIAVCVKWVDLRPEIDALSGRPAGDGRSMGFSAADEAAVEVALRLGEQRGNEVLVVCVGPEAAEEGLRGLLACGVHRVRRVALEGEAASEYVATVLAASIDEARLVICGDYSADRGSGSVPAFLAHHLGAGQALGLVALTDTGDELQAVRRLDGSRREILEITGPSVLSVEGGVTLDGVHARLRRAALSATLAVRDASVEVVAAPAGGHHVMPELRVRPLRPRARALPAPEGASARDRVVELTGALTDRVPPRTIEVSPEQAAAAILEQLAAWGYR